LAVIFRPRALLKVTLTFSPLLIDFRLPNLLGIGYLSLLYVIYRICPLMAIRNEPGTLMVEHG